MKTFFEKEKYCTTTKCFILTKSLAKQKPTTANPWKRSRVKFSGNRMQEFQYEVVAEEGVTKF